MQIPVNSNVAAELDAHVERVEEKRLRRLSEIDEANRAKRASFLTEFRTNLEPVERARQQVDQAAVDFALTGVKSCYVLNGGALVVIPALLQITKNELSVSAHLVPAVVLFAIGIFFSALANYLAYRSMYRAGEGHAKEVLARVKEVSNSFYPPEDPSTEQAAVATARIESNELHGKASRLADIGVVAFILAILVFLIGVSIIIYGMTYQIEPCGV